MFTSLLPRLSGRLPGLRLLGPAFLISVGYMDPGNWATALAAGSEQGFALLWVLVASCLSAWLLQSLSARLGIVSGMDLAEASRHAYGPRINRLLFPLAMGAIIATDLAEVIGMAIGLKLLFGLDLLYGVVLTVADTLLFLLLTARGMKALESAVIAMILMISLAFVLQLLIVAPAPGEVASGLIVRPLDGHALYLATGIMGATIMPHNLYLHSALLKHTGGKTLADTRRTLASNTRHTGFALGIALCINAAILIVAASAFHHGGEAAGELAGAHQLLGERFGALAAVLFAIALVLCGQASTLTGTLAGRVVMEGHGWRALPGWQQRIATRAGALLPALAVILLSGPDSLNGLLVLSQVVLSLQLGFAMIPLLRLTASRALMGTLRTGPLMRILGGALASLILLLNGKMVVEFLNEAATLPGWQGVVATFVGYPLAAGAALLLAGLWFGKPFAGQTQRGASLFSTSVRIDLRTLRQTSSSP